MAEDARLSIVVEAKIDKLTDALSRVNGQVVGFSQRGQKAFDDLRAQVDPVGLAADRMAQKIAVADKALAASKITAAQHAQALEMAAKAYEDVKKAALGAGEGAATAAGGLNRLQLQELTHVARSLFDQLVAGQNPLRALALESGRLQVAVAAGEGGLSGFAASIFETIKSVLGLKGSQEKATETQKDAIESFNATGEAAKSSAEGIEAVKRNWTGIRGVLAGPIGGIAAFAAALVALFVVEQKYEAQQRQTQATLRGFGAASGATVSDIEKIADAAALAGEATHDLAVQAETAFLKAGASKDQLAPAVAVLKDFAALAGQDTPEALKTLAGAIQDPVKFVDEFGGSLLNLTAAQVEHIHQLVEMGDKEKAVAELLRDIGAASKGAGEDLKSGFGRVIDGIGDGVSGLISKLGELLYNLTHKLPAAARIAQLEKQKAELDASPAGLSQLGAAQRGGIDAQLARLRPEAERDAAKVASAKPVGGLTPQEKQRSIDADADLKRAAPDIDRRRQLVNQREAIAKQIANPVKGSSYTDAERQKALSDIDRSIAAIDKKGVTKPETARTRQGPEDQTATLDAAATQALDRAQQGYLQSLLALTVDLQDRAEIEKKGIDAGLQKQLDALEAEEVKVRKSKNDAHKTEQIATLESAKIQAKATAENQKDLVDRQAVVALADKELRERQRFDDYYNQIASINEGLARTAKERLALELADLAERKRQSDRALAQVRDDALSLAQTPADRGKALQVFGADQAASNDLYSKQQEQARHANMSPLEAWRDQSLRTAADIQQAYESVATKGLDSLTSGITDAITGTKSLGDAFKSVADGIIADLIRIAVQRTITQPLADALFPTGGGLFGFLGGVNNKHALGTDSAPGGLSLVGERGPEVVNLPRGAQVIPNDILRQLSRGVPQGGGGVTVVQHLAFDARGAVMTDDLLRQMNQMAAQARAAAVSDARRIVPADAARRAPYALR